MEDYKTVNIAGILTPLETPIVEEVCRHFVVVRRIHNILKEK
jgi:hypothetical protein